ncbi:MAG: DNA/RNA nuclease SfsA [Proteobacteria bacterium]|nr:DNA/RNA nuclease SfsA [Pseudomonadota bacterium]
MKLNTPLTKGVLVERYKRFFADVKLADGSVVTAHCANSGSMMNVKEPGSRVWLSANQNPKAKLDWRWEMIEVDGSLVGINTMHPNRIVEEAINADKIKELTGYSTLRREVRYGSENSRIDLLLEDPGLCYVEVKNVTLKRGVKAEFPDAVTTRGAKHLRELSLMVRDGHRAVMVYLVQRPDCQVFTIAGDIDPAYAETLDQAIKTGVEVLCYQCVLSEQEIVLDRPLKIDF